MRAWAGVTFRLLVSAIFAGASVLIYFEHVGYWWIVLWNVLTTAILFSLWGRRLGRRSEA